MEKKASLATSTAMFAKSETTAIVIHIQVDYERNLEYRKLAGDGHGSTHLPTVQPFPRHSSMISLIPRPRPTFHCFQYGKAGEGLVSFFT